MHWDCPSGIRHGGGAKLNLALVWNVRTWPAMLREKAQAAPTARPKVLMRRRGADCLVVVRHRLCRPTANETLLSHCRVVGIELRRRVMPVERRGWVIAFEIGSTGNGRNPIFNGRRQPSCGGTSRMTRECQVRIWCSEASCHSSGGEARPQRGPDPVGFVFSHGGGKTH